MIDTPDLNFGLVRFGHTVQVPMVIRNTSQISAKWSIKESAVHSSQNNEVITDILFENMYKKLKMQTSPNVARFLMG